MDEELAEIALYILAFVLVAAFGSIIHQVSGHVVSWVASRLNYQSAHQADVVEAHAESLEEHGAVLAKAARSIMQAQDRMEDIEKMLKELCAAVEELEAEADE